MENNNSKQVLFSIIGVAILIVAVVGVSFAFFTYSKTGTTNNVITTGKIEFLFDDPKNPSGRLDENGDPQTGTPLTLTNAEPQSKTEGEATAETDKYGFGVDATLPNGVADIKYEVYVVKGDLPGGAEATLKHPAAVTSADGETKDSEPTAYIEDDRIDAKYISIMVETDDRSNPQSTTETKPNNAGVTIVEKFKKGGNEANQYKLMTEPGESGTKIAEGTLTKGAHTFNAFKLSMWINSDLKVSDTDADAPYRASRNTSGVVPEKLPDEKETDDRPVYSDAFYSLKVKIIAGDQVGIG